MSGTTRIFLTIGFVIVLGLCWGLLRRHLAKRTVANWAGTGAHDGLAPHQAALLLGLHPSTIVAILLEELRLRGRARPIAEPHEPLRMEWTGGAPEGAVEEALLAAVEEDGTFRTEGVLDLLETIYEEVNEEMVLHSGRATAVRYRDVAEALWEEDLEAIADEPGSFPFFLLHDPKRAWDRLGDDEADERFKAAFRRRERFEQGLVPPEVYAERAKEAGTGFFRWRGDLKKDLRGNVFHEPLIRPWPTEREE